ncbi:MAG: hypothetical protein O7E51_15090, partial [Acidobacteria bacterium]|nr:hypothetical protein [Acidobacteriota bacterium]
CRCAARSDLLLLYPLTATKPETGTPGKPAEKETAEEAWLAKSPACSGTIDHRSESLALPAKRLLDILLKKPQTSLILRNWEAGLLTVCSMIA